MNSKKTFVIKNDQEKKDKKKSISLTLLTKKEILSTTNTLIDFVHLCTYNIIVHEIFFFYILIFFFFFPISQLISKYDVY